MSPSEVLSAIKRALVAGLAIQKDDEIIPYARNLLEFIFYGLRSIRINQRFLKQNPMKPAHILALEALAILALLTAALLADDPLDREAETWLQIANSVEDIDGNGYYYLLGIAAAESDEPSAFGRGQAAVYREAEAAMLAGGDANLDFTLEKPLLLPGGYAYCHLHEDDCVHRLFNDPATLRRELEAHALLLERYRRFLRFHAFKTLIKPNYYEVFSPFEYVSRGNKLFQFQVVLDAVEGRPERAVAALLENIERLRKHLEIADSLVYKLVLVVMLAENLELLTNVYDPAIGGSIPAVAPLTYEERSLHRPMVREFGMNANTLLMLSEQPQTLDPELAAPRWMISPIFKPNMSINDVFRLHRSIHRLALLSPQDYRRAVDSEPPRYTSFSLRNLVGWILGSIAAPELFGDYVGRINDIDAKIALLNTVLPLTRAQWTAMMQDTAAMPAVRNPYDPEQAPYIDAETQSLCFNGPYEDRRGHRCVKKYRVGSGRSPDG